MNRIQNDHQELKDAYARLGESVVRVGRLEAENAALRAQLEALLQSNDNRNQSERGPDQSYSKGERFSVNDKSRVVTIEQFDALGRQYAELQNNHSRLQSQHAGCQPKIDETLQKARNHKNAAKEWKAYSERRERQRNLEAAAAFTRPNEGGSASATENSTDNHNADTTPRPPAATHAKPSNSNAQPSEKSTTSASELPSSPPRLQSTLLEAGVQEKLNPGIPRVTSRQTTVEDEQRQAVPDSPVNSGPNSDSEPIAISSRSLKRTAGTLANAGTPARRIKQEPDPDDTIIDLISETTDDQRKTPEFSGRMAQSDLDITGAVVVTPHQPKRVKDLHPRATSEEAGRSLPQLNRLNRAASSISDRGVGAHGAQSLTPISIKAESVGETSHRNQDACATDRSSHRSDFINGRDHTILRPISGNVSNLVCSKDIPTSVKPRAKGTRSRAQITLLSEGGDDGSSQIKARLLQSNGESVPSAESNVPLEKMLNEPSQDGSPSLPTLPQTLARKGCSAAAASHLTTPVSAIKRKSPVKQASPRRALRGLDGSPPPVRPEDEPLRLRDVKALRLQDFKINPKYMGTDYAFADTLRGRDQRRALHTCSRPDCCGVTLQKVIAMGGASLSGKTDAQALEAYIGPNWRDLAKAQGPEKEKQLTLQAHAHCFANQHGKHRQAFVRCSTPPGFWRTDFPTTQEAESDREKARAMERDAVEERYHEAMREGGRWKFKDE